ncbi:uncharacterized protein EAF01_000823 [Botrytis porri]|uniref:uncharacterized protein n=1 Tax=Botrytis porri TaxID=87229 RepID=UPI001900EBB1|nr:uncharacterized protein EAF01_000823 [Botrytis porri]KAF7914417.1 hypothetical protein EAF01_000823 [Botrytis porri]
MGVITTTTTILEEKQDRNSSSRSTSVSHIKCAIYNIYIHSLSKFPGPKLWTASRLPFIYYLLTGQLVKKVKEFHDIYGEFYRLAPDGVSFASEQAWNDIYTFRRGHKRALRDKVWYIAPNNQADNLITTTDFEFHARARGLMSNSLMDEALRTQYPLIESHADMLISKVRGAAEKPDNLIEGEQRQHSAYAEKTINRRLDAKSDRPDFMTPFMRNNSILKICPGRNREGIVSTFNFIVVGGSETSARVMTGIFSHLTKKKNKRILDRLRDDIRTKFKEEREITLDAIQSTPIHYLEAVINEGLRMCNPIPSGLPRVVPEGGDDYCGTFLSGGTRLAVRTYATNRSKKIFADPDEFVPERWLPKDHQPMKYANDQLSASKPSSVGFHSCLGRPLAWADIRLAVTRLLWMFHFSVDGEDEVDFDEFPVIMIIQKHL